MEPALPSGRAQEEPISDEDTAVRTVASGVGGMPGSGVDAVTTGSTAGEESGAAAAGEPVPSAAPPAGARGGRSPKDMAISLMVLLLPLLLVFGACQVLFDGDEPPLADPAPALADARNAALFRIDEPTDLGDGWRPVRASFRRGEQGATLRIGYHGPDGGGVQLVQSNMPVDTLLPTELTAQAQAQGATEVAGRTWQRYSARPGELALVLLEPERTVIVVGSVPESVLRQLAGALR